MKVDSSTWNKFRQHAVTQQKIYPGSTLPDTIRKLRYIEKRGVNLLAPEVTLEIQFNNFIFSRFQEGATEIAMNNYIKAMNRWVKYRGLKLHFELYEEHYQPPRIPTPLEIKKMADVRRRKTPEDKRDRTLIILLAGSGLRIGELISLEKQDIDYERGRIHVRRGKGGKSRYVYVDHKIISGKNYPSVKNYVEHWRRDTHPTALFTTKKGKLTYDYARKVIKEIGKKAGVPWIHPHAFRHYAAVTWLKAGWPLKIIQAQLGHEKSSTTDRYLEALTEHDREMIIRRLGVPDPLSVRPAYRHKINGAKKTGGAGDSNRNKKLWTGRDFENFLIDLLQPRGFFDPHRILPVGGDILV